MGGSWSPGMEIGVAHCAANATERWRPDWASVSIPPERRAKRRLQCSVNPVRGRPTPTASSATAEIGGFEVEVAAPPRPASMVKGKFRSDREP